MLKSLFPILDWLPKYNSQSFVSDLKAGTTTAVMLVPQGLAYAIIAGLPPIYGLYAALLPQILYTLMGTSRHVAVGPVALDSLIVATAIGSLSVTGLETQIAAVLFLTLLVGGLQLLMGVLRMGVLVNYLSKPVISGFTSAAAIIIGMSQVKYLLGIEVTSANQIQHILASLYQNIGDTQLISVVVCVSAIILILVSRKIDRRLPAPLIVTLFGIGLVAITRWDLQGLSIVGHIPKGLPNFLTTEIDTSLFGQMLPLAFALAVLGYMEIISIGKGIEEKEEQFNLRPNQEFVALGTSNMFGALFQSYPVSASFSRSAVNYQAGAKTNMAGLMSAAWVGLFLLFFTQTFYYLPIAVLAGIIMVAVFGLIDISYAKSLFQSQRDEFYLLIITLLLTLFLGITQGIVLGVLLSLLLMVVRTSKPHHAVLGRIKGTQYYKNKERFEQDIEIDPELLIFRFDAQLFFGNRDYFKTVLTQTALQKGDKLKGIILVARGITYIDSSGLSMLQAMVKSFKQKGVRFMVAGAIGPARDILHKSQLDQIIGKDNFFAKTSDAVDDFKGITHPSEIQKKVSNQTSSGE